MNKKEVPYNPKLSYAFVIGVGKRPEDDNAMKFSALDAERVLEELLRRCPFESENVKSLSNEAATREGILKTLDEFILQTKHAPADMFLLYFSGHGYVNNGKYFLVCRDTENRDIEGTAIESGLLVEKLQAINSARMLVLLDCCHSAGMTKMPGNPLEEEAFFIKKNNRVVLTASAAEQVSFLSQPVSVFTYALIKGLAGSYFQPADRDVTVFDLAMYVRELVYPLSKSKQQPQLHVLKDAETSNFVLAHYPDGKPAGLVFKERFQLLDASGKEINTDIQPEPDQGYRKQFQWLKTNKAHIKGEQNVILQGSTGNKIDIQAGNTTNQKANKIYNIDDIDDANFS